MPTHKLTYTMRVDSERNVIVSSTLTNQGSTKLEIPVPSPSTNLQIAIAFALAQLKSIFIFTDGPLTLETNDSGTPDDTFALDEGKVLAWDTNSLLANPFSADVEVMYATVAGGGETVNLTIIALVDATP
jgi:hypothetical protein